MTADQLRKSILQQAIQGKLIPQDPNDEPASALLERIRKEKARLVKEKKIKKEKNPSIIFRGEDNSHYEKFTLTGEVKCIDDEIPFNLPAAWEWCRLEEITLIVGGYAFPSESLRGDFGIRIVRISDFNEEGWVNKSIARYNGEKVLPQYEIQVNDLLLAMTGGTVGKSFLVQRVPEKLYLNQRVAIIRSIVAMPEYINVLLKSSFIIDIINSIKNSTNDNISMKDIASFLVPLPPLAEQRRIVAKIEDLMSLIEQYGKAQSELEALNSNIREQLKKSVLQYAIEGKLVPQCEGEGTAEDLLKEIQTEKQRLYAEGKLKKKDLGHSTIFRGEDNKYYEQINRIVLPIESDYDFPNTWEVVRLSHICRLVDGEKKEGQYVCLDTKYLRGKSTGNHLSKGKFVNKGDNIILVDGENSGEVFTAPHDGYMGSTFKQLWVSSCMYLPYVLYFIQFYKDLLRNSKKGAAIPHLNKDTFYSLVIGIPPYQEQKRIANAIGKLYARL